MFGMKCTTLDNKNESMENVIFRAQDFLNFANMFTNLEILPLSSATLKEQHSNINNAQVPEFV
jgi:hypothetical protein